MKTTSARGLVLATIGTIGVGMPAFAQDAGDPGLIKPAKKEYSPYLNHNYPDRVFWGDTHLHTSYSWDAGMAGNTLGPDGAYRFAKGEVVTSSIGVRTRLLRPLDFLVVTDHAENLGLAPMISESNSEPSTTRRPTSCTRISIGRRSSDSAASAATASWRR